jgi:two-component system sensor histidine kinase KdpD
MLLLHPSAGVACLALLLVLTSAVASLWLSPWGVAVGGVLGVAAFDGAFMPPRAAWATASDSPAWLLAGLLVVNGIVGALILRQRGLAQAARCHVEREERLRNWSDTLRDATDPAAHANTLRDALAAAAGVPVAVVVSTELPALREPELAVLQVGEADTGQHAGLMMCLRLGAARGQT